MLSTAASISPPESRSSLQHQKCQTEEPRRQKTARSRACVHCAPRYRLKRFLQTDSQITLIARVAPTRRSGDTRWHLRFAHPFWNPDARDAFVCVVRGGSLFLCLSLSSARHCLIGATKGKHACELQEARGIHIQLSADQNNRGWHCTHAVTLAQSIIFASLSARTHTNTHTHPATFATQPWLLPHLPPSVASPWKSWGCFFWCERDEWGIERTARCFFKKMRQRHRASLFVRFAYSTQASGGFRAWEGSAKPCVCSTKRGSGSLKVCEW